jgi:hypothetical protein
MNIHQFISSDLLNPTNNPYKTGKKDEAFLRILAESLEDPFQGKSKIFFAFLYIFIVFQ